MGAFQVPLPEKPGGIQIVTSLLPRERGRAFCAKGRNSPGCPHGGHNRGESPFKCAGFGKKTGGPFTQKREGLFFNQGGVSPGQTHRKAKAISCDLGHFAATLCGMEIRFFGERNFPHKTQGPKDGVIPAG